LPNKKPPEGRLFHSGEGAELHEIARTAFGPLAFLAFGDIPYLAVLEKGLHLYFAAARAEKLVRGDRGSGVLAGLCHIVLLLRKPASPAIAFVAYRPATLGEGWTAAFLTA
jgi:hypothetical protein